MLGALAVIRIDVLTQQAQTTLQAFADAARGAPRRLFELVNSELLPSATAEAEKLLNVEVGPVKLPFQFASARSRRFYMAAARKGELPNVGPNGYERTGKSRTWKVQLQSASGDVFEVVATNEAPYATYVFGPRQVPGHALTGHPNAEEIIAGIRPTQRDKVVSLFFRAVQPEER